MRYHIGVICKNGHCISCYGDNASDTYCKTCGAEIITKCQDCGEPIRGVIDDEFNYVCSYDVPSYCFKCGNPFPWTKVAIESASEIIKEESALSAIEQEKLIGSLPDIVSETPRTQLAIVRMQKAFASAGRFAAEGLRQFAIDFGCELAKKQLGM